jgi:hypothetical protein
MSEISEKKLEHKEKAIFDSPLIYKAMLKV